MTTTEQLQAIDRINLNASFAVQDLIRRTQKDPSLQGATFRQSRLAIEVTRVTERAAVLGEPVPETIEL